MDCRPGPHLLAALLVVLAFVAMAPVAQAQSCLAAPGNSAIDEYCESVPTPAGPRGTKDPSGGPAALPAKTEAGLRVAADGPELYFFIERTAPQPAQSGVQPATGLSGGLDDLFKWVIIGLAALMAGLGVARHLRRDEASSA